MTSATVPTTGNACLKQAAATPLKEKLLMPMINGLALPVSIWIKMKRKAVSTFRKEIVEEVSWNPTWEPEELQITCESFKQSLKNYEKQITTPNLSQHASDKHLIDLKNKGSLPPKRAIPTNTTMSIIGTKSALTSNPPTHRLTLRPQGIVKTGSQPLISWSIKKRVPYPPQMTLCFLKCTLAQ